MTDVSTLLAAWGHRSGAVLGAGVEGTVVALGATRVAKVWRDRSLDEVNRLAGFYATLAAAGPVLATPEVERVGLADGVVVSVERRLPGRPLWTADGGSPDLTADLADAVVAALAALAGVPARPGLRALPVLPGGPTFDARPFAHQLAQFVSTRATAGRDLLGAALPDLEALVDAVTTGLRRLEPAAATLLHGDLIAANVLAVDGRATALIDFGFLTTTGDPAFDAAVAASCFDMYGPRAREVERDLDRAIADALGYDATRVATYRAAYALVTATCFGADGSDGHFAWCVRMLRRPDVQEALAR